MTQELTAAERTQEFISNEMGEIEKDFHKAFYAISALPQVLLPLIEKSYRIGLLTKNQKAAKELTKLKNATANVAMFSENYKAIFKVSDKSAQENWTNMFADVIRVMAITLANIDIDRYDEFASLLIDWNQGNIARVEEHLIDSLLDYEESKALEGFSLIQRYAPNLTVEQKEEFSRDLVKWRDFSNMTK